LHVEEKKKRPRRKDNRINQPTTADIFTIIKRGWLHESWQ